MEERKVKIYTLKDPESNEIRYLGITVRDLNKRLAEHIYIASKRAKKYKNAAWIKSLLNKEQKPIIELLDEVDFNGWEEHEKYWINQLRSWGFNLTNILEGGQGTFGLIHSEKSRKQMSEKRKGRAAWNKGIKNCFSQEYIENVRKRRLGQKMSKENKEKIVAFAKLPKSEITKNKLREATIKQLGKPIQLENIITGEKIQYACIKDCAKQFNVYPNAINTAIKRPDSIWRETFLITYINNI